MPPALIAEETGRGAWIPWTVIAGTVLLAYANALGTSFQFDDWNVIVDEPKVASFAAWWDSMPGIRPLLKLSYALNHAAGGGSWGFHAVNVGLHLLNAWLVQALFARAGVSRQAALIGALMFALHPVQTEAVTYVSGRSNSLMALLALASLLAWVGRRPFLSAVLFAAALMAKETAAILPAALLLAGMTVFRSRQLRFPWLHMIVLGAAACVALGGPTYGRLLATSLEARGIGVNLLTQAEGVTYLMGQIVRLDRLNADPGLPVVSTLTGWVALEAAAILLLIGIGLASITRRPALAFGILWFFVWLVPTNSILPRLDVANDRQLYVALLGPAWLLACGAARIARRRSLSDLRPLAADRVETRWRPTLFLALAAGLAVLLCSATHLRNRVYATEIVYWEDVAGKSPHNARAFNNLGYACALEGRIEEAEAAFLRAMALRPDYVLAAVNLRLLREGRLTPAPSRPHTR